MNYNYSPWKEKSQSWIVNATWQKPFLSMSSNSQKSCCLKKETKIRNGARRYKLKGGKGISFENNFRRGPISLLRALSFYVFNR